MKLHNKLMLVYLITILLPIVGLTNYFFKENADLIIKHVSESYQKLLIQTNSSIYYNIRFYDSILDNLTVSESIQNVLTRPEVYREKGIYLMNKEIDQAVPFIQAYQATDIESIEVYSIRSDTLTDGKYLFPVERLQKHLGMTDIPDHKFWILDKQNGINYYSLIRPVHSIGQFKQIGYLKLTIKIPSITYVQEAAAILDSRVEKFIITDEKGTIMYDQESDQLGERIAAEMSALSNKDNGMESELDINIAGTDYVMWFRKLDNVDWTSYLLVPKAAIQSKVSEIRQTVLIVSVLCMIVFSLLTLLITRQLTQGIRRLHSKVSRAGKGLPSIKREIKGKYDEIAELDRNFDNMLENLSHLIHQNYIEKLERREADLNFLQTQINPHFLYNTLDSIKNEIDINEKDTAIQMVIALADLFRISVSKGTNIILWENEIYHAKCYLKIMEIRFGMRYHVVWDIEPEVLPLYTLKILLQPILENAIQHGLKNAADGTVIVQGERAKHAVIIKIKDNGIGMSKQRIDDLFSDDSNQQGIGLKNVNSRIKIYFGNEYGVTVQSEPKQGTEVTLTLPVLESDEHV